MTRPSALLVDAHDLGPGLIKEAAAALPSGFRDPSFPKSEDLGRYGDDDFGVVMVDGGTKIRKFACPTPEAAWVQSNYLLESWDDLPKVAAITAGLRLVNVMGRGHIENEELTEKIASAANEDVRFQGEVVDLNGLPAVDITGWTKSAFLMGAALTATGVTAAGLGAKHMMDKRKAKAAAPPVPGAPQVKQAFGPVAKGLTAATGLAAAGGIGHAVGTGSGYRQGRQDQFQGLKARATGQQLNPEVWKRMSRHAQSIRKADPRTQQSVEQIRKVAPQAAREGNYVSGGGSTYKLAGMFSEVGQEGLEGLIRSGRTASGDVSQALADRSSKGSAALRAAVKEAPDEQYLKRFREGLRLARESVKKAGVSDASLRARAGSAFEPGSPGYMVPYPGGVEDSVLDTLGVSRQLFESLRKKHGLSLQDASEEASQLEYKGRIGPEGLDSAFGHMARILNKTASFEKRATALGGKYPIDTPDLVKTAERYFHQHQTRFHPTDRRTFAVNTVKQAAAMGVPITDKSLLKYAGQDISTDALLHIATRGRDYRVDDAGREFLSKLASQIPVETPDYLAGALVDFDEHYGLSQDWDRRLPDPYAALCTEKVAEEYVWSNGVDRVTEEQLNAAASRDQDAIGKALGESGCKEFCKSPVSVFKSLPDPIKKIVARVASTSLHDGGSSKEAAINVHKVNAAAEKKLLELMAGRNLLQRTMNGGQSVGGIRTGHAQMIEQARVAEQAKRILDGYAARGVDVGEKWTGTRPLDNLHSLADGAERGKGYMSDTFQKWQGPDDFAPGREGYREFQEVLKSQGEPAREIGKMKARWAEMDARDLARAK